jgi:hypothetical protein
MPARPLTIALLSVVLLAALSGAANAATTVSLSATRLAVIGDIGRNDVRVRREPGRYRVSDAAGALVAQAPCVRVGADVDCQSSAEVALVRVVPPRPAQILTRERDAAGRPKLTVAPVRLQRPLRPHRPPPDRNTDRRTARTATLVPYRNRARARLMMCALVDAVRAS